MTTMNGITNELLTKKARKKWQTRCGAFLLAVVAAWNGAYPSGALADIKGSNVSIADANAGTNVINPVTMGNIDQWQYIGVTGSAVTITQGGTASFSEFQTDQAVTLNSNNGTYTFNGYYNSTGGAALNLGNNNTVIFGGAFSSGGTTTFGSNTTATFNGVATLAGGTLNIGSDADAYFNNNVSGGTINSGSNSTIYIGSSANGFGATVLDLNHNANSRVVFGYNNYASSTYNISTNITGSRANLDTGNHTVVLNGGVSATGDIYKYGSGRLAMNSQVTSGADYRITQGTVSFNNANNLGTGDVIFYGDPSATLQYSNANGTAVGGAAHTITNNLVMTSSGQVNVVANSYGVWYDNTGYNPGRNGSTVLVLDGNEKISGLGQLTKTGAGRLEITGSNQNFLGTFAIVDGTVYAHSATSLGANQQLYTVSMDCTTGRSTLAFNFSTLGNDYFNRGFVLTGQETMQSGYGNRIGVTSNNEVRLRGNIRGTGGFIKDGAGKLIIDTGDGVQQYNSYAGSTIIADGTLAIYEGKALGTSNELSIGWNVYEDQGRISPILETQIKNTNSSNQIVLAKDIHLNTQLAAIRTVGADNITVVTGVISHDYDPNMPGDFFNGNLHKTGEGTLRLEGNVINGFRGQMYIGEGTLAVGKSGSLSSTVHFGSNGLDYNVQPNTPYQGDESTLRIFESMSSSALILLDRAEGNIIEVDDTKTFTHGGNINDGVAADESAVSGGIIKRGRGTLVLKPTSSNTFSGTTTIEEGSIVADAKNVIANSSALIMYDNTLFDMSGETYDQKIGNLVSNFTTAKVDVGNNTLTLDTQATSIFEGNIVGAGKVVKAGSTAATQTAGFDGFSGSFDIQAGGLKIGTDTYITGLDGNALTTLDVYDKVLTIDIAKDQQYKGTIMSSAEPRGQGRIVKDGAGTLSTRLVNTTGANPALFDGSIEMRQGNMNVDGDITMKGDMDNELVFYVNDLTGTTYSTINATGNATFEEGTTMSVMVKDGAGWNLAAGQHTVGVLNAGPGSVYTSFTPEQLQQNLGAGDTILTPNTVNSLFYRVGKLVDATSTYSNLRVVIDVTGIGGIGDTYNQQQVGANLDAIRTGQTTAGIADMIRDIWAHGSNITSDNMAKRQNDIKEMLTRLSGDTMANAMFLGLNNHTWRSAFERLNLDAQMYYAPGYYQQGYRGQSVANIRRVWFNPYTVSMDAKTDNNARSYGVSRQGFVMGYDRRIAQNASAGLLFGYSNPYLYQDSDRVRAADFHVGAYAGAMIGYYFELKGYLGYGHQQYESTRVYVNPEWTASTDKRQTADGRFGGDTFAFSLELARPLFLGFSILRPTLGLESQHVFRGSFSEGGDAVAMAFRQSDYHQTVGRFGVSVETCTFDRFKLRGKLFYTFQLGGNDYATASSQFVGIGSISSQTARSVAVGTSYFDAGIGAEYYLNPQRTFALFGDYNGSTSDNMVLNDISLGFSYIF